MLQPLCNVLNEAAVADKGETDLREVRGPGSRATGVVLRGGAVIKASRAVISNATVWDTIPMLPQGAMPDDWQGGFSL